MVKVSVVILTWNSQEVIDACLASLAQGLTLFSFETIVVDNGSQDRTLAIVQDCYPWVQVVKNTINRGVASARNQGLRAACGEYLIFLDDDTVVHPEALDRLITYMGLHGEVGLCGPKLLDCVGKHHLSCRLFPTVSDKFARRLPFAFARRMRQAAEMADWDHATTRDVDYMIGACQVIRRAALIDVGFLDEHIFYGPEDVDFCLRLQQAGWRVVYHPEAVVSHIERRITRAFFSRLSYQHMRGLLYYFWKHGYWWSRRRLYARLSVRQAQTPLEHDLAIRPPAFVVDAPSQPEVSRNVSIHTVVGRSHDGAATHLELPNHLYCWSLLICSVFWRPTRALLPCVSRCRCRSLRISFLPLAWVKSATPLFFYL